MELAIEQANIAKTHGEIPVGAILVNKNQVIASAYNLTLSSHDPTAHAEILVIRQSSIIYAQQLYHSDLYVTLEPCAMCAQAISFGRVKRLYFGAYNPKGGGVEHGAKVFQYCHHIPEIYGGILETKCSILLKDFFQTIRNI
ncbi:nucleoside deaminase [Wolbachia endosymbiont of Howardula sp.]|uniref:nucleoside deaminase n=1 Tax=Wolbachia endosymbiont of Howardula sp. TaxID=2916816 RepID=UPI00217EC4DA|nr:nucleoside deaminase [Wolbachia endosymbiont of Howardula sp.]UWI83388.1 nucleoside deaminase [Wolbachia endosymbiont of Howardula sp.]